MIPDSNSISESWKILYPSDTYKTGKKHINRTKFYQSLTTLFSFLYSPLHLSLSSISLRIPELMNCVVTLSGYRDRDTRSLVESDEVTVVDDNGEKYGRRELKQAIRFSGACYSGPLLSHVVTHLVCSSPTGKKYLYALSTQRPQHCQSSNSHPIHIVNEMWILDCIRYQRRIEESDYLPYWMRENDVNNPTEEHPRKYQEENSSVAHAKKSVSETSAIQTLLQRVQGSAKDTEEFQYGPEGETGEADEEENCQHESEVIEEEALELEVWNEKVDHHSEKEDGKEVVVRDDLISPIKQPAACTSPVFLLGGGSHAKYRVLEQEARDIIIRLGGTVLPMNSQYSTCTHLILWELKRTEKFLCCCASGKWILHPEYLIQSAAQGTFLPEKPFEWSEKWISGPNPAVVEKTIWLGACRRGRLLALKGQLPYQDQKVVIDLRQIPSGVTLGPPVETLVRIIECGGGEVLEILTGQEDTQEEKEIGENSQIDYFVRYPCCPQPHSSEDSKDAESSLSSHLVSVLLVGYFLDRISLEKVDIREYIVTKATRNSCRRRKPLSGPEEDLKICKKQRSTS